MKSTRAVLGWKISVTVCSLKQEKTLKSRSIWCLHVLPVICSVCVRVLGSFKLSTSVSQMEKQTKTFVWSMDWSKMTFFFVLKWINNNNNNNNNNKKTLHLAHYVKIWLILSKRQIVGVLQRSLRHHYQKTSYLHHPQSHHHHHHHHPIIIIIWDSKEAWPRMIDSPNWPLTFRPVSAQAGTLVRHSKRQ